MTTTNELIDMEKIDLTKCNNCRYKAKIDGIVTTGIVSAKDGINAFLKNEQGYDVGCLTGAGLVDSDNRPITDFEIVPRVPETYRDWQVGDKIIRNDGVYTVIFRCGEVVLYKHEGPDGSRCCSCSYTCEELFRYGYRLVLTDIEKQIIEERKKYEPQDGDIVAWKDKDDEDDDGDLAITIYRGNHRGYFTMFINGKLMGDNKYDNTLDMNIVRPATDEERQKLFDAMAKAGKRWNAEKKVVEDIPEETKTAKHEFKKFDPVLVRNSPLERWKPGVFYYMQSLSYFPFVMADGTEWSLCLPLNEKTVHLLGTNDDYEEEEDK